MPDVPIAIEASARRADTGRLDSTRNINGASVIESEREASENIFNFLKVFASGPR